MQALTKTACIAALLVGTSGAVHANPIVVRGATLVDVRDGRLIPDAVIVVDGDRIVSAAPGGATPAGATVLDAKGKYVIPGLIDLHVHYKDWSAELYLNHGVTTVVSLGDTYEWIKAQKEGIAKGVIPGPRMFHSTENLDQTPKNLDDYFVRPHVRLFDGPEDARAGMRGYAADRVDAVKVYDGLSVPQLQAIVAEAAKANIPVIGHFTSVRVAADVGAHGIEHLGAVANAILDDKAQAEAVKKVRKGFRPPAECFMDARQMPAIVDLMVKKGLYLNPTLRMAWQGDRALREKGFHYEDFDLTFNDWRLRYIPLGFRLANLKEFQEVGLWNWRDLSQYEVDLFHQGYVNSQRLVKTFFDAGGKLYAGTDSANMAVPGLSMHQELELLVDAGVSPLGALQAATIHPASLMRLSDKLGTVEAGKVGDLVVLDGNPLEHIRNTRKIWRVISRGKVLDGEYHADFKNPIPKTDPEQSSHFFPSPRIKEVTPVTLVEGGAAATLKVTGTGFIPYSFVLWNGEKVATEFVSTDELNATIPSDLVRPGSYPISVENPDFAWGSIYARGASDIAHLGIQDNVSNEVLVMVMYGPTTSSRR
jgi:imidazolonepropionase-like amidohydrolase